MLQRLESNNVIHDTLDLAKELNISHVELDNVLKSLSADEYVSLSIIARQLIELTDEGKQYAANGTPEF